MDCVVNYVCKEITKQMIEPQSGGEKVHRAAQPGYTNTEEKPPASLGKPF